MTEKVIIIGGGPAGLAAAIYNARAELKPFVLAGSPPGGQLTLTSDVENYPGFEAILGPELVQKMRDHALKFGTRFVDKNVLSVDFSKKPFRVTTVDETYEANAIIIATGAKALWLGLESETRLRGKGVSACATCDGFFFRNKTVAVIGGGDTAMEDAMTMTKFATKVYVIHRRGEFRASKIMQERVLNNPKIEVIWNTQVTEVLGQMKVEGVKLKDNKGKTSELKLDGVFVAIGHKPDTDVFKGKIELDEKGYIVTKHSMTSVPGVFAGGDCVDHRYKQAATAVGLGVAAALDCERWLEEQKSSS
ncbi:MAG: thioredoxin-disulfide reductase [Patescibacteria group bacterium]